MGHTFYHIPPGYVSYDYPTSTSTSPSPDDGNDYYPLPRFQTPSPHSRTKSRGHVRTTSYQTPRTSPWAAGVPIYTSPGPFPAPPYHSSPPPPMPRYEYTTSYEAETPQRSRVRRSSTNTRPKATPTKPSKPPAVATAADAAEHNIPAGYSLKNWDPTEEPILLLGSVFDANSLGKWIYDWTVYHHKAGSPMTEVAGELWLLLIKFAGKVKRAEEGVSRVRGRENRECIRDFLKSGDRIWERLKDLIKSCEEFMWRAAKKEGSKGKSVMGEKSGIEFVKSIFGRERELERTEKLMTQVRLFNMRFDANCEDLLRRPGAA